MNMDELLAEVGRIAWSQCWQVTLLIAGVWLLLRLAGRNRPHLACGLWLVVLLKCITPPLVSSPSGVFCWMQREKSAAAEATAVALTDQAPAAKPTSDAVVAGASPVIAAAPAPFLRRDVPLIEFSQAESEVSANGNTRRWPAILLAAVLCSLAGTIVYAALALARWRICWRKLCQSPTLESLQLADLVEELRQRLKVRRTVRLWITESSLGPAVVGLWRPTIILPAALVREKSPPQLAPLVAHELIHIRRGDLWIGLLQTLAVAFWWFHPLVRLASRLVTREAERCCDEATIAQLGCRPADYARTLLDVLALKQQLTPIPAFPGVRPVDVTSQRLERIMQLGQGCHKRTPWWCWLSMLILALAVLPGAALVVGAKEKPPKRDPVPWISASGGSVGVRAAVPQDPGEEQVRREYDIGEVLADLKRERGLSDVRAEQFVADLIRATAPGAERMAWERLGAISVSHSPTAHDRIAALLTTLRDHGHAELAVDVRIISGPKAVLDADSAEWRMIGASGTGSASDHAEGSAKRQGTVRSVVERSLPAMLALIGEKRARALLDEVQSDSRTNVLQAPKVTLFNGQSSRIEDRVQRPFVVGVEPAAKGGKTALKPRIEVISEGMTIDLRPVARKDGSIELDFGIELSHIRDVETAEFPTGPGKEPITVQVPELHTTLLNATAEMKAEQTLVLSVPKMGKGKKEQQAMCVLVKVTKLQSQPAVAAPAPAAPPKQAATPSPQIAAMAWEHGDGPTTKTLVPGGWDFKLRPREGHRLQVEMQETDRDFNYVYGTGLRIEAMATSTESTARMSLEGAKANVRMPQPQVPERGRPPREPETLFFEVELNGDVSGVYRETKFRADRLFLTVEDPYVTTVCVLDGKRVTPSSPRKPSSVTIMLDGNVQLSHNGSRIEAARAVLRIDPAASDSRAGVQIQVDDGKAIELPSPNYHPDDVQYFPPGPERMPAQTIEKVYAVADLAIPIPNFPRTIDDDGTQVGRMPVRLEPDFARLIDAIQTGVEPKSWSRGNGAAIVPIEKSLSLSIRQTADAHKQIARLLDDLRSLQDQQIVLSIVELRLNAASLAKLAKEGGDKFQPLLSDRGGQLLDLSPEDWKTMNRIAGPASEANRPKVTLFSGQSIRWELQPADKAATELLASLDLQPFVMADFRYLRLSVQARLAGDESGLAAAQALDIPRGDSVLVDLSAAAWRNGPRTFTAAAGSKPQERRFYLITPRTIVSSEQEVRSQE